MEQRCIRSTPYSLSSAEGFTLVELLVTTLLGLVVVSLTLASVTANRNVLARDTVRTRLNQDLRGALDIVGSDVRVAGENLGSTFPAIEITNAASLDTFVARRNLLDEVLPVCTQITAGTNVQQIYFAIPGTIAGCVYSGHTHDYTTWQAYRQNNGNSVKAFIFDSVSKNGEFFDYTSEGDNGTSYWLIRPLGTWTYTYPTNSSAVYILEEWEYLVQGEMLQIVENRDTANPYNVSFGITGFQVTALMQDGTTKTSFTTADSWTQLSALQFQLTGTDSFRGDAVNRSIAASFFPRNILSH